MLAHEGLWPLRASCPFLHMALSIEPQAACTLKLMVTGSVTQVSLLLPSFPAFVSSYGSSTAKARGLNGNCRTWSLPKTTACRDRAPWTTSASSLQDGFASVFPLVSCAPNGSHTLLLSIYMASLAHGLFCFCISYCLSAIIQGYVNFQTDCGRGDTI